MLNKLRNYFEKVVHYAVGRYAEDGGLGILVYGDDNIGGLHADKMLYLAADTAGDIKLGADRLSRLSHLMRIRYPAGVDSRS